jgi:hypothetical protein
MLHLDTHWGQFGNPEGCERPVLEAATTQQLVKSVADRRPSMSSSGF